MTPHIGKQPETVRDPIRDGRLNDDAMMTARQLVENHIRIWGMVPHPDKMKEEIADALRLTMRRGAVKAWDGLNAIERQEIAERLPKFAQNQLSFPQVG